MAKVISLFEEFADVFSYNYLDLKVIPKEFGELRLVLQLDAKVV
jgi:hypothetical protein